jgi:hypothetical protein
VVEKEAAATPVPRHDVRTEAEPVKVGVLVAHQRRSDSSPLAIRGDGEQRQEPIRPTGTTVTNPRQKCLEPVWVVPDGRGRLPLRNRRGR